MDGMPHPIPQHMHRQITRHGNVVWYVRIGKGPRTRIRAEYGTAEFFEQYRLALAAVPKPSMNDPATGTLAWLMARYRRLGLLDARSISSDATAAREHLQARHRVGGTVKAPRSPRRISSKDASGAKTLLPRRGTSSM